jgi:DNA-directed RNA polymerase specialized sigma24 family protein
MYVELRRFAAVVADSDIEPDDLVQEAVAQYLRRFAGSEGADHPAAYLRSAIVGLVSNHRRSAGRRRRSGSRFDESMTEVYPSDTDGLLACTSPIERALLLLVDLEGEPIGVAAGIVGLSTVAARARLSRVRRRLRVELKENPDVA